MYCHESYFTRLPRRRKKPNDSYYFQHDYNARNDEKIKNLIRVHKMLGYGIFWSIVEDLYNNGNKMQINYKGMAKDYHTKPEIIQSIIDNFNLFVKDNENFGSKSIEKRINERDVKSKKATISAFYRWGKDADALREELYRNARRIRSQCYK